MVVERRHRSSRRFRRLVERIAQDLQNPEDAHSVIEQLAALSDWDWQRAIQSTHRRFLQREYKRVKSANRRASRKGLPATLTLEQWLQTLDHYDRRCAYCRLPFSYDHLEHVVPLATYIGGTTADNCAPSCWSCNSRKGTKPAVYWKALLNQGRLFPHIRVDDFAQRVLEVRDYLRDTYNHQYVPDLLDRRNDE